MEDLQKMLKARDSAFEEKTLEIFKLINTTLVCVTTFLSDIDPLCDAGTFTWEDANIVDDLLVVMGSVDYTPGTTFESDGNEITITEENLEYFRRVVHMNVPLELATTNDEDAIMEFLYTMHEEKSAEEFSETIDKFIPSATEFDLTQLTDEQLQSLKFYNMKARS